MPTLIDIEDELSRLQSALTLLQMAVSGHCIEKEESNALYLGLDHAMEYTIQIQTQLTAMKQEQSA